LSPTNKERLADEARADAKAKSPGRALSDRELEGVAGGGMIDPVPVPDPIGGIDPGKLKPGPN
jgi:hypothetical protein